MSRYAAVAIAALALAAACSDANVAAPAVRTPLTGPVTRIDTLRGTIRLNGDDAVSAAAVVLVTTEGAEVTLIGPVADLLANAAGMDIWIAGEFTATGEMIVQSYSFLNGATWNKLP